ncbi:hypothetical protein MY04_2979 [Flammeovirga sp. MY04]|uniref:hypothetical protein n=1 Tax=Flammeovirga sp. MY04 TaxID=1191459 RepID=UPI0008061407|nr:hypothetical protein [Flammeovirga sp. MY04]ANQ50347.1 hypothetical protein MY04_2979 [Flammeovirga sp. MY04]
MRKYLSLFFTLFLTQSIVVNAQSEDQNLPYGRFFGDSIMLGEEIKYSLRYEHPPEEEVLFPDSTYNFAPFELLSKQNFNTRTLSNVSVDCVVYSLATYEIDSVYELGLPVMKRAEGTTDSVFATLDGIFLREMIPVVSDSTKIIADVNFLDLETQFNTPLLLIILGSIVVLALLFLLIFGKRIKEGWRKKKVQKQYDAFKLSFDKYLQQDMDSKLTEDAVAVWKAYLSKAIKIDIQPLTSKETGKALHSEELEKHLKVLDRVIYSGQGGEEAKPVMKYLDEIATKGYAHAMVNDPVKPFEIEMNVVVQEKTTEDKE